MKTVLKRLLPALLIILLLISLSAPLLPFQTVFAEEGNHEVLPEKDLSNVAINLPYVEIDDALKKQLSEDLFAVMERSNSFISVYEMNTYEQIPSFITADAMLHLYHLLFSNLLIHTEDKFLYQEMLELSQKFFETAKAQAEALKGSDFETAAEINLAFISIGCALLDDGFEIPQEVEALAREELQKIRSAEGLDTSPLSVLCQKDPPAEDYSQYKVRGYYTRSPEAEDYFRAMMWYGRINFSNEAEISNRCALLMSLAIAENPELRSDWDKIYELTSLFAGASDDLSYRDFLPLIEATYGKDPNILDIAHDAKGWSEFHRKSQEMRKPAIFSELRYKKEAEEGEDAEAREALGFRFMGQRFSADQDIFGALIYSAVGYNENDEARGLPDVLDLMSAFGSEKAETLLKEDGAEEFKNYADNLAMLRETYGASAEASQPQNLSAAWLESLRPLLDDKRGNRAYPPFMRSENWACRDLECFAGSFSELKHDTVLYAKQVMAEMGGFFAEDFDDRGYVQPEPELFRRLASLARQSADALKSYEMIDESAESLVEDIAQLAERLADISEKELQHILPTEDDFNFIRSFGGNLDNLSSRCLQLQNEETIREDKLAIVADVATDPGVNDGRAEVLELGLGNPQEIWVIVQVEDSLRLAVGAVYNFYQFSLPISERLTDEAWRERIGAEPKWDEEGNLLPTDPSKIPEKPRWTRDYRLPYPPYKEASTFPGKAPLPDWVVLKSGEKKSRSGVTARFMDGRAQLWDPEGSVLWESPKEWSVQDLHFVDADQNGREDLMLLCWKEGRYGSYCPFG